MTAADVQARPPMDAPADALRILAERLRRERTVIADHVVEPDGVEPALGLLAAAGPRTASAPGAYAMVVEAIHEGYLLHYRSPRLLAGADADLALLAGDYLYALGLKRLASLGDLEAVGELSDLISLAAQIHADRDDDDALRALWLASVVAVACGPSAAHDRAKRRLRDLEPAAPDEALGAGRQVADAAGIGEALDRAAKQIDFGSRRG